VSPSSLSGIPNNITLALPGADPGVGAHPVRTPPPPPPSTCTWKLVQCKVASQKICMHARQDKNGKWSSSLKSCNERTLDIRT
jgi:hypothetical protein